MNLSAIVSRAFLAASQGPAKLRCPQCWQPRPRRMFVGARGGMVRVCSICREKYSGWERKTFEERLALQRPRPVTGTGYRVGFVRRSGNKKLGPIPVSITDRASCPPSCLLRNRGCYAEFHNQRMHWERVARTGMSWAAFCAEIAALPPGTLWRHNEAGDLPGKGEFVDAAALDMLVVANLGRRGFTFTHKLGLVALYAIARAVERGFTVNLSADSLEDADLLASLEIAPVVVVVPEDAPAHQRTPGGRHVVVCPNQTHGLTCARCQLCAKPQRKAIVGFRAHGQYKALVSELVRTKRVA